MAEKTTQKTGNKAEFFKKFLTLNPWFINKLTPKLKPVIKPVYYIYHLFWLYFYWSLL